MTARLPVLTAGRAGTAFGIGAGVSCIPHFDISDQTGLE